MVYLVKDAAKLSCLVLTDPSLLMTNCLGHYIVVLVVAIEGAIGLHRLLIKWCFSLLLSFCRFIYGWDWLFEVIFPQAFLTISERLPWLLLIWFVCSSNCITSVMSWCASPAFLRHQPWAAHHVTAVEHTRWVRADRVILEGDVLLIVRYQSLGDLVIERVSEEFAAKADLIWGWLHIELL